MFCTQEKDQLEFDPKVTDYILLTPKNMIGPHPLQYLDQYSTLSYS